MKNKVIIVIFVFVGISLFILEACKKMDIVPNNYNPTYLQFNVPAGWPSPSTNIFSDNPLTEEGFQLGKKLFYDGRLSKDGNFPCGNCHQQVAAFGTYDHDLSHGHNNSHTQRNAPPLFNLAWNASFHWDGGINNLLAQPLVPITASDKMGENIDSVILKLKKDTAYPQLFRKAFGSNTINSVRMLKALAQFTGSLVSYNSKYDKVKKGEANFTTQEQNGYDIYKAKCAACHSEPTFTDQSFRNTGLAFNSLLNDRGRMEITRLAADSLKFKVPSLRNVELSFPYMHDGRMTSLGQVIDHYRTGIITTQPGLDPLLVNRIPITNTEKTALLNFLYALTDTSLSKGPRYAQ